MLARDDVNASGGAGCFAHHTGHAARRPVVPFCQPMAAAVARGKRTAFFRVLECDSTFLDRRKSQLARQVLLHVGKEVTAGKPKALEDLQQIQPLGKIKIALVHLDGVISVLGEQLDGTFLFLVHQGPLIIPLCTSR